MMKSNMRRVLIVLCVFALLLVSIPAYASDVVTNQKMTITIGYCPYGMLETSVMKEKQFYKKYLPNVHVNWFFGLYSVHLINNWIAGKLQIAYLGDMPAIMLQAKMHNTRWVDCAVYPNGKVAAIFVTKNSPIKTIKELNGKTVAVAVGSSHDRLLRMVEKRAGIKVNIVNQSPEVAIGNLEAGKIDAWIVWPPYISLAEYKHIGRVLVPNLLKYEPEADTVWPFVVSDNFAKKYPKIVEGLVRADLDLHKFMKEHPDQAAEIVYNQLKKQIPLIVLKRSLAKYRYTDEMGKPQIEAMQRDIDFLASRHMINKPFKASQWADTTFLDEIHKSK